MFDQSIELSSDLEWMLLSGQVDEMSLVTALVSEYYLPIYCLNLAMLQDEEIAEYSAVKTLATAVLDRHHFSGRESLQVWIYSRAYSDVNRIYNSVRGKREQEKDHHKIELRTNKDKPDPQCEVESCLWQAVDQINYSDRILLIMATICNLSHADLSHICRIPEQIIYDCLAQVYQQLENCFQSVVFTNDLYPIESLAGQASQSLKRRWSLKGWSEKEVANICGQLESVLKQSQRHHRRTVRVKEVLVLAATVILVVVGLSTANSLFSEDQYFIGNDATTTASSRYLLTGKQTEEPYQVSEHNYGIQFKATPVTPAAPLPPLTIHSDNEMIRERISQSADLWNTAWEEGQVFFYGPVNYTGPPIIRRYQQWISRDIAGMVLSGPIDGEPDDFVLLFNSLTDQASFRADRLGEIVGGEFQWSALAGRFSAISGFAGDKAFLSRLDHRTSFEIVGVELLANREVLIVDQINVIGAREARLWIDTITGKLLREQHFEGDEQQILIREALVSRIYYDIDFPDNLFLQWDSARRFPILDKTERPILPWSSREKPLIDVPDIRPLFVQVEAPEKFNPSRSRLVFQWFGKFRADGVQPGVTQLYADGLYLGDVGINHPMGVRQCQRSSDGQLIVFLESTTDAVITEPVRWFRLNHPEELHTSLSVTVVRSFSIAPDSRRLAVFGVGTPVPKEFQSPRGIFILDTFNGERLASIEANVDILVGWKPDGEYVGGIKFHGSREDTTRPISVLAFNVETGEVIEGKTIERLFSLHEGQVIKFDFSELGWEGEVSVRPTGLEGCISP